MLEVLEESARSLAIPIGWTSKEQSMPMKWLEIHMKLILILRPLEGGGERRENTFPYSAFGCDVDIGSCEHQYSQADPKPKLFL